ncbi:hypothetical protein [Patulibacter americanus]|uniref:hypothetical protein n=1 Tax=Patulibacter americanus TaxID=588672 RepID=UPI0003B33CD9|nr:hypothetical protein [Patulibacter americanus]
MTRSPTPTRAPGRSRSLGAAAVALLATLLATLFAAPAMALPPGGPNETRNGATLTVNPTFVTPGGTVAFSGRGFTPGEVLVVKVDDGDVKPTVVPPTPPGGVPNATDGFTWVTADGEGAVQGTVNLADTSANDQAKVASGKHHIRLISSSPRSIHADFAVHPAGPAQNTLSADVAVAPAADQTVNWGDRGPFVDIAELVPGSLIPYRIKGFGPHQVVGVKVDDLNLPSAGIPGGVWTTIQTDADGAASGLLTLPDTLGTPRQGSTATPASPHGDGSHWLRFLGGSLENAAGEKGPSRSVAAAYSVDATASPRTADVAVAAQRGRSLSLTGTGLQKRFFYLSNTPGNSGDGQTVTARLDGTGTPFDVRANNDGTLTGAVPIPAGTSLGTHTVDLYVGFRAGSDFPQAVYRRTFEVTEFVPDPTPQPPAAPPTPTVIAIPSRPTPTPERAARVASTSLKAAKNRIALKISRGSVARKVAVTVRTKAKVRVGKRKKVVTLAKATTTVRAGTAKQSTTVKLKLTAQGRALLKRVTKVRVVVRVAPTAKGAKATTRTVWLRG